MATTTQSKKSKQRADVSPQTGLAFWQQVVVFATAVITLLTGLVTAASGMFTPSGSGILASKGFWTVYGFVLLSVIALTAAVIALGMMRRRLIARGYRMHVDSSPQGYTIICNLIWWVLFVPYLFAVSGMLYGGDAAGAVILVWFFGLFGVIMGGMVIADSAFDIDKLTNPWDYRHD